MACERRPYRVHSASDDTTKGVPCLVIKPVGYQSKYVVLCMGRLLSFLRNNFLAMESTQTEALQEVLPWALVVIGKCSGAAYCVPISLYPCCLGLVVLLLPCSPIPGVVVTILCQELRDPVVEIRIELVNDALILHN